MPRPPARPVTASPLSPDSPAAALGLQPGDVVLSVNGVDATEKLEPNQTQETFTLKQQSQASIGKPFRVAVQRKTGGDPDASRSRWS